MLFIVFIIALQQLEGNLIYPKVVGSSIGAKKPIAIRTYPQNPITIFIMIRTAQYFLFIFFTAFRRILYSGHADLPLSLCAYGRNLCGGNGSDSCCGKMAKISPITKLVTPIPMVPTTEIVEPTMSLTPEVKYRNRFFPISFQSNSKV